MALVSFASKVKQVTPHVTFKISKRVTPRQRRLVNEYHRILFGYVTKDSAGKKEYVSGLATGLRTEVRPKGRGAARERALAEMRALAGQSHHRYLTGVWFDTIQGKSGRLLKPRIGRNRRGELYYEIQNVRFGFIPFRRTALARDARAECERILREHAHHQRWLIQCGKHQSKRKESSGSVADKVVRWQNQYSNSAEWLLGLVPIEYTKQVSFRKYRAERDKLIESRRGKRHGK